MEDSKKTAVEQQGYAFSPRGFVQSAEKGDQKAVLLFLESGVDINTRDEHGWTPLMISTFNGREEVALLLIRSGADVNAKDTRGVRAAALGRIQRLQRSGETAASKNAPM